MRSGIRNPVTAALAFAALLLLALLIPLPHWGRESAALGDLAHAPVFAVFAAMVHRALRQRGGGRVVAALVSVALLVGFGCATEIGQYFVGRYPSLRDLAADTVGAIAGTAWAAGRTVATRSARVGLPMLGGFLLLIVEIPPTLILIDAVVQRAQMPQVASFEQPLEITRWYMWDCRVKRVKSHATEGDWSLEIDFQPARSPGIATAWTPPDWSEYEELVFDVELDEGGPLDLFVVVQDQDDCASEEGFEQVFHLVPGPRQIRIPLSAIAAGPRRRRLDLRQVRSFQLIAVNPDRARTLFLDNVHLR
jgi:VanZ family protein